MQVCTYFIFYVCRTNSVRELNAKLYTYCHATLCLQLLDLGIIVVREPGQANRRVSVYCVYCAGAPQEYMDEVSGEGDRMERGSGSRVVHFDRAWVDDDLCVLET